MTESGLGSSVSGTVRITVWISISIYTAPLQEKEVLLKHFHRIVDLDFLFGVHISFVQMFLYNFHGCHKNECLIEGKGRETIFTCPHSLKFRTRPFAGTASGMASDSVRGRGFNRPEPNHIYSTPYDTCNKYFPLMFKINCSKLATLVASQLH